MTRGNTDCGHNFKWIISLLLSPLHFLHFLQCLHELWGTSLCSQDLEQCLVQALNYLLNARVNIKSLKYPIYKE